MAQPEAPHGPMVIIGAGQAGFAAAEKLRDLGHTGPVTMIGAEPVPPYQRPPLSKAYLLGDMARERLFLRPTDHYAKRQIDLRLGQGVQSIRTEARQVVLKDGSSLPYDRLLLATGAAPRRLPAAIGGDLNGVLTMRDLGDADDFAEAVRTARHLLVVGGGYVGLEAAASARKLGLKVTLIEAADRILKRVASAETSAHFRALHLSHDVDLREGVGLTCLIGDSGKVVAAELSDGSIVTPDLVLVGIGVAPNVELAAQAGLTLDAGIAVDAFCQTSAPGIFAAGDCTSFSWNTQRIRLESVGNAIDQAEVAAANMLGQNLPYHARPWFWSDQYDTKLQIAGLARDYDRVVLRPGATVAAKSIWYFAGGKLEAVDAINEPRVYMIAKRLLEAGQSPGPDLVADSTSDLRSLVAA